MAARSTTGELALDSRSLLYRTAKLLSVVGSPLVTSALMIGVACFHFLSGTRAIALVGILVPSVIGPILWWTHRGVQSGRYSDLDVSRRQDRKTVYPLLVLLPLLGSAALWGTDQPRALHTGMLAAGLMSLGAFIVNRWIKISLHASFSFFYAVGSAALASTWVAPLTLVAILVTVSRWVVGRHVWRELILGALLGCAAGYSLLLALGTL